MNEAVAMLGQFYIRRIRSIQALIAFGFVPWIAFRAFAASDPATNNTYPVDLPTVLRLAGAQNLDVQIARQRLKESEAEKTSANEKFFPWIGPGITYHRRDGVAQAVPSGIISDAHFQSYAPGVTLSAQLEIGDAIYQSLAARQVVHANEHALETQRQATVLAAAQGYFDLVRAAALIQVANQALKTSEEYEAQLHEAVGAGIALKGDELRVQTQTRQYQVTLRQKSEAKQLVSAELARLLHLDPQIELLPQENAPARLNLIDPKTALTELVQQGLKARPELHESVALLAAAREQKKGVTYGPLIPSLNAQIFAGGLGGGPDSGPDHFAAEGDYLVGLTWKIGPGGLFDRGRVRLTEAQVASAELTQSKIKDAITAEVVSAAARLQSSADQIGLAQARLDSAAETLRLTQQRKQFGVGVVLEDIQAQQELERARADYVNTISDYNKAQYALQRAIGGSAGP